MINSAHIMWGHCSQDRFFEKVDLLESKGYAVVISDWFQNDAGKKFIQYSYYRPIDGVVIKTKSEHMHKRVSELAKENI